MTTPWADDKEAELRHDPQYQFERRTVETPLACDCRVSTIHYTQSVIRRTVKIRDYCIPCRESHSGCFHWTSTIPDDLFHKHS